MTNTIHDRRDRLANRLKSFTDKDERLKYIIDEGRKLSPMDEKFKMDQFQVKGCISKAWLFPQFNDGTVNYKADSEALIVKGIIALLLEVYNGSTPEEIESEDGSFLGEVGVTQHLSTNRRNGLANVLKMIQAYAAAFKKQS